MCLNLWLKLFLAIKSGENTFNGTKPILRTDVNKLITELKKTLKQERRQCAYKQRETARNSRGGIYRKGGGTNLQDLLQLG